METNFEKYEREIKTKGGAGRNICLQMAKDPEISAEQMRVLCEICKARIFELLGISLCKTKQR